MDNGALINASGLYKDEVSTYTIIFLQKIGEQYRIYMFDDSSGLAYKDFDNIVYTDFIDGVNKIN